MRGGLSKYQLTTKTYSVDQTSDINLELGADQYVVSIIFSATGAASGTVVDSDGQSFYFGALANLILPPVVVGGEVVPYVGKWVASVSVTGNISVTTISLQKSNK